MTTPMTTPNPTFDEFKSPRITLWRLTRAGIEHENTLTNHRITWLLYSQAFLLAVFGVILHCLGQGRN